MDPMGTAVSSLSAMFIRGMKLPNYFSGGAALLLLVQLLLCRVPGIDTTGGGATPRRGSSHLLKPTTSSTTAGTANTAGTAGALAGRRFYATTTSGSESILLNEIKALPDVTHAKAGKLGCTFQGTALTGFAAALQLRTSLKVCEVLAESDAGVEIRNPQDLYVFSRDSVAWCDILSSKQHTIRVESVLGAVHESLSHSHYTSLTVKNAIVDHHRDKTLDRPNVDIINPDVPLLVYLHNDKCTIYRVWSGASSMHKRGYRGGDDQATHKASLRETTAASLLLAAGYTGAPDCALLDPMCGSASIPIEAALIKLCVAPGLIRYETDNVVPSATSFLDVEQNSWKTALETAKSADRRQASALQRKKQSGADDCTIYANDIDPGAMALAVESAKRAKVFDLINFSLGDVSRLQLPPALADRRMVAITNPPWALRLEEGSQDSWTSLGEFSRRNLQGRTEASHLWVLAGNPALLKFLELGAPHEFLAMNAANVDMRFLHYVLPANK